MNDCAIDKSKRKVRLQSQFQGVFKHLRWKKWTTKDPQREEEYTWNHCQPGRVVSIADRVPCQTSVLARILKRHIAQEENL